MKIAIPVDMKDLNSDVCVSFGRAPYFLIYDTDTKESAFIVNTAASSSGGAGIKAAQNIVDNKANVLLTPRCGENAANVLIAADISLFKTIDATVKDNIDSFIEGKLSMLNEIHEGFHGYGGK